MYNPIYDYKQRIVNGEILVSQKIIKQINLLIEMLEDDNEFIFDYNSYLKSVEFIQTFCKHSKGEFAGKPVILELWQLVIHAATFGIINKDTGYRKHNEVFVLVARKNGKSTWASAIALFMLIGDGESGADVYATAVKMDQAKIVFEESYKMANKSKLLTKYLNVNKVEISFPSTESIYKPLASDTKSLDGLNGHCYIMDEIHAWRKQDLYDLCKGSLGARRQPLMFKITTAGTIRQSVFDSQYEYAEKVLEGKIEDTHTLAFMYELDSDDEIFQPEMFEKANPNMDVSVSKQYLVDYMNKAKNSNADLSTFKTKHCNRMQNHSQSWLSYPTIKKNNKTFGLSDWQGSYCVGGVDLSSTTDLTAATILVPTDNGIQVLQQYFIPKVKAEIKIEADNVPYNLWEQKGFVTYTEGAKVDYSDVTLWFTTMREKYNLTFLGVGYDLWNAQYFTKDMEDNSFEMTAVRQGYKTLSSPMKLLEADFEEGKVEHNNNPIAMWNFSNVAIRSDENGNIAPIKSGGKNSKLRIDGFMSLLDAYVIYQAKKSDFDFIRSLK